MRPRQRHTQLLLLATILLASACDRSPATRTDSVDSGATRDSFSDDTSTADTTADETPTAEENLAVETFAYANDGPYAAVLVGCTYEQGFDTFPCGQQLPYIGQDTNDPAIDDVLARLVVSHSWMGDNLKAALALMPDDMLPLFRSVTAIVVASDSRPTRFSVGRIYLDPQLLWLIVDERATIVSGDDLEPDLSAFDVFAGGIERERFPSEDSDAWMFRIPSRHVRNGEALDQATVGDGDRSLAAIIPGLARELYHELAHAVDQMPPVQLATVATDESPLWGSYWFGPYLSTDWSSSYPIRAGEHFTDSTLHELALVRYAHDEPLAAHTAIEPPDLIAELSGSGGLRFFSYLEPREDFAIAFETAMMGFHYGYESDIAITDGVAASVDDAIVVWGQRGRLGEPQVYNRVLGVVQAIYPGELSALESYLASRPPAAPLQPGATWGETLDGNGAEVPGQ